MNQDRTARLCRCGCHAILLPQDSRDHASLECAERSRQIASKRANPAQNATDEGVWDMLPPLAPVIEFPKVWIARAVAGEDEDSSWDEPVEVPLKPAASVAQVRWARDMIAQAPRKTQEQIALENHTSWEQLAHWARSSTDGLPERAARKAPPKKAPAPKAAAQKAVKAKETPKPKAKEA